MWSSLVPKKYIFCMQDFSRNTLNSSFFLEMFSFVTPLNCISISVPHYFELGIWSSRGFYILPFLGVPYQLCALILSSLVFNYCIWLLVSLCMQIQVDYTDIPTIRNENRTESLDCRHGVCVCVFSLCIFEVTKYFRADWKALLVLSGKESESQDETWFSAVFQKAQVTECGRGRNLTIFVWEYFTRYYRCTIH